MLLTALLACTSGDGQGPAANFAFPSVDLGAARAASSGFDPADGEAVGRALDAALPVFGADDPLWETPLYAWELLQRDLVRDPGVCPFDRIEDGATVHVGGCRSSQGYEFDGDVAEKTWSADGADRTRLSADVVVIGDTDGAIFDRIAIQGAIERAVPEDGSLDQHLDINLRLEVLGYWERYADDPRVSTQSEWIVSGTAEEHDGVWVTDLAVEIGGAGGMTITSDALAASGGCPIEVEGEAVLGEGVTAGFGGTQSCDACAVVAHGGTTTSACAP